MCVCDIEFDLGVIFAQTADSISPVAQVYSERDIRYQSVMIQLNSVLTVFLTVRFLAVVSDHIVILILLFFFLKLIIGHSVELL